MMADRPFTILMHIYGHRLNAFAMIQMIMTNFAGVLDLALCLRHERHHIGQ